MTHLFILFIHLFFDCDKAGKMSLSVRNTLIGYPLIIQVKIFLSCLVIVLDTNKGDGDVILPLTLRSHVL